MLADSAAGDEVVLGVSDFVAALNQTLDFAYPSVVISGELANFRISKNRWLYFDLKDELATVKFFGTVRQLPSPLEDGMVLKVRGAPRLHHLYGFSVNVMNIQPAGEGTIRRAAQLLQAKLAKEGLFDDSRKRPLPYPPRRIGLVTSIQSAAYADFTKILRARWRGVAVDVVDTQVQGEAAPAQLLAALEQFNTLPAAPDAIVMIRGGGSAEDLAAFNNEALVRAVAASRVPVLAAIGHETDLSLVELAADRRASTPSNAAELLVPDRRHGLRELREYEHRLDEYGRQHIRQARSAVSQQAVSLSNYMAHFVARTEAQTSNRAELLEALNPAAVLRRGYAIVRQNGQSVRAVSRLAPAAIVNVELADGSFDAAVSRITKPRDKQVKKAK
jgi:exodeoxyribonuclease VII large subunit